MIECVRFLVNFQVLLGELHCFFKLVMEYAGQKKKFQHYGSMCRKSLVLEYHAVLSLRIVHSQTETSRQTGEVLLVTL